MESYVLSILSGGILRPLHSKIHLVEQDPKIAHPSDVLSLKTKTLHPKTAIVALIKKEWVKGDNNMVALSNIKVLLALALAFTIHSSHAIANNLRGAGDVSS